MLNAYQELDLKRGDVEALAHVVHSVNDIGATIASGSFATVGMVIAPCSMKTLACDRAWRFADNLIARAADVCLKERRRLVLLTREAPLNLAHIRNMEAVTLMGGVIFPPVPALYQRPASIDDMVDHTVLRVLDLFDLGADDAPRWSGQYRRERSAPRRAGSRLLPRLEKWCRQRESNPRPSVYKTAALPAELCRHGALDARLLDARELRPLASRRRRRVVRGARGRLITVGRFGTAHAVRIASP